MQRRSQPARVLILNENESVPSDRRVWAIARTLTGAGFEVVVLCPQGDEDERAGGERQPFEWRERVEIHRFAASFASGGMRSYAQEYALAMWRMNRAVRRMSRRRNFDVVHVCNPPDFIFLAALPALRRGARLVFDHHDLTPELFLTRFGEGHRLARRLTLAAERMAIRAADTVLATNDSYRRIAVERGGKAPDSVFIVRNGPDLRTLVPVEPDPALKHGRPLLLAYLGVMAPQDGVDYALHALAALADRPDWHAVFAGEGAARPQLERLSRELGIADRVQFTGWLGDAEITRLLSTADICLSPEPKTPLNDSSTMVKLGEYLAFGRPVVAFDLAESRLAAGEAALYAHANDPAAFASAIEVLLDDPDRRMSMGACGRRRARTLLSWQRSEERLLAAYEQTLALGRRPRPHIAIAGGQGHAPAAERGWA
ncbi:MAG: glycosyltransferase family 4 protein [Solirubrobacteraceae bacterium]